MDIGTETDTETTTETKTEIETKTETATKRATEKDSHKQTCRVKAVREKKMIAVIRVAITTASDP